MEHLERPLVVDGVEGFGGVQEEHQVGGIFGDTLEKKLIDVDCVIHTILLPKKTLLGGLDEVRERRHEEVGDGGGQDPVISIRNADGAGIRNQAGVFFREEEEEAVIEARGGVWPLRRRERTEKRRGAARSGAERQAAKGIPSGPGVELLERKTACSTASREGDPRREWLSFLR
jgi:hypothetical protein